VNSILTATYWEIGRRIVEHEQQGASRAEYGQGLLRRLAKDLTARWGRGFGIDSLQRFRLFYLTYPSEVTAPSLWSERPAQPDSQKYATLLRISGEAPGTHAGAAAAVR